MHVFAVNITVKEYSTNLKAQIILQPGIYKHNVMSYGFETNTSSTNHVASNTPSLSQSDTTQWLSTPAIQTYNNNQVQVKSSRPQREMTSLATVHGVTNTLGYNI